jgi:imidazolonepropionase
MWDTLFTNGRLATMRGGRYGTIEDGAIGVQDGRIEWIGAAAAAPGNAITVRDLGGAWVTPGLVDCHTHLVYAGNRATEFEMRLNGASYEEIALAGGGVLSTMNATRAATEEELAAETRVRLKALMSEGVTTVEIKSGYGLETRSELKCLRAARSLAVGVDIRTTFLGAHAVPPEFKGDADGYIDLVCNEMIPRVAAEGLADAVDAFCEGIGFTPAQVRRVFEAARKYRLRVKLHADQLSNLRGAALAAEFRALSADHLEYTDEAGVFAMGNSGTVAVLLPGAFYTLREKQLPPVEALRKHGVPMAVATDSNPGTSPTTSLTAMMNMACTLFRLTPEEALAGVTCHAARALGLEDRGTLEVGRRADLAVWDISEPADLCHRIGGTRARYAVFAGGVRA